MKKLSIFFAVLATLVGFSSCEDDKTPVLQTPTQFVLNTPALAEQFYELTPEGSVELTCSQPDYGYIAAVTYGVEIALKQNPTPEEIVVVAPEQPSQARMVVPASKVAEAMCSLMGLESKDDFNPLVNGQPMPVYIRATAMVGENEGSLIKSNWVTLKHVIAYPAIPEPAFIYFVGAAEGWEGPDSMHADHYNGTEEGGTDWRLYEKWSEIGSQIYWGVFDIPADKSDFRFYTGLTGWDTPESYGAGVDNFVTIDFPLNDDGTMTADMVQGQSNFNISNWEGGLMTICVNMSQKGKYTVTCMKGDQLSSETE